MPGTIFRLPDQLSLQRGITYTIMPDGRSLRVPVRNKLQVRADSQSHEEDGDHDIVQALQDILGGKKPVRGRAWYNNKGRAAGGRVYNRPRPAGPAPVDPGEGFRQVMEGGERVMEI